jgi:hypothetical protein
MKSRQPTLNYFANASMKVDFISCPQALLLWERAPLGLSLASLQRALPFLSLIWNLTSSPQPSSQRCMYVCMRMRHISALWVLLLPVCVTCRCVRTYIHSRTCIHTYIGDLPAGTFHCRGCTFGARFRTISRHLQICCVCVYVCMCVCTYACLHVCIPAELWA